MSDQERIAELEQLLEEADERRKAELAAKDAMIQSMKCCGNCYFSERGRAGYKEQCAKCKELYENDMSLWTMIKWDNE
jgi:hypothetical protein